jgi:hypothetical protein
MLGIVDNPDKTCWLPKVRIEQERREAYEAAVRRERAAGARDLTLSQWIRETLDEAANR